MDSNNLLLKMLEERYDRFLIRNTAENGDFLTPEEQAKVLRFIRARESSGAFLFGGYPDAERKFPVFMPEYTDISSEDGLRDYFLKYPDDCPVSVLQITVPRQEKITLSHRDYLGALMGLGIRREKIGDILVTSTGAQILVMKELAGYLRDSLTSVGRASVITGLVGIDAIDTSLIKTEDLSLNVSSPRLDNVVSAVFSVSRKDACEAISRGLVFTSGYENLKPDYQMKPGEKLVLRGKGKAVYNGVTGQSRKGKSYISVTKYL